MNDRDVLLGKADELLLRLRSSSDAEFPVLTEIVEASTVSGRYQDPPLTSLQSSPLNEYEIEKLRAGIRAQLSQSLEIAVRQWTDEILFSKLQREIELAFKLSLDRAMEESRKELLLHITETLENVIDRKINALLLPRT